MDPTSFKIMSRAMRMGSDGQILKHYELSQRGLVDYLISHQRNIEDDNAKSLASVLIWALKFNKHLLIAFFIEKYISNDAPSELILSSWQPLALWALKQNDAEVLDKLNHHSDLKNYLSSEHRIEAAIRQALLAGQYEFLSQFLLRFPFDVNYKFDDDIEFDKEHDASFPLKLSPLTLWEPSLQHVYLGVVYVKYSKFSTSTAHEKSSLKALMPILFEHCVLSMCEFRFHRGSEVMKFASFPLFYSYSCFFPEGLDIKNVDRHTLLIEMYASSPAHDMKLNENCAREFVRYNEQRIIEAPQCQWLPFGYKPVLEYVLQTDHHQLAALILDSSLTWQRANPYGPLDAFLAYYQAEEPFDRVHLNLLRYCIEHNRAERLVHILETIANSIDKPNHTISDSYRELCYRATLADKTRYGRYEAKCLIKSVPLSPFFKHYEHRFIVSARVSGLQDLAAQSYQTARLLTDDEAIRENLLTPFKFKP